MELLVESVAGHDQTPSRATSPDAIYYCIPSLGRAPLQQTRRPFTPKLYTTNYIHTEYSVLGLCFLHRCLGIAGDMAEPQH